MKLSLLSLVLALVGCEAPNPEIAHMQKANDLYREGRFDAAEAMYRLVLYEAPDNADAACNLGSVLQDMNRRDEAIESYRAALAIKPTHADAHYNLGVMYQDEKRNEESLQSYLRTLEVEPGHLEALANIGSIYQAQEQYYDAEERYRIAIATITLADTIPEAQATEMLSTLYYSMGIVLDYIAEDEEICPTGETCKIAIEKAFENSLKYNPDNVLAQHNLAAVQGDESLTGATREYVTTLFDDYASTFDESLAELRYQAPDALSGALKKVLVNKRRIKGAHVVSDPETQKEERPVRIFFDAGCGTGLLGPLVRNFTETLIGVDLSEKMVAVAHERNIYDELLVGDIEETLLELQGRPIDVVAAADVFVYFGDMSGIFEKAAMVLSPGGIFTFTTEELLPSSNIGDGANKGASDYLIQNSGRFAHRKEYLEALANTNGFSVEFYERFVPRLEYGWPIDGQLFVFLKK